MSYKRRRTKGKALSVAYREGKGYGDGTMPRSEQGGGAITFAQA